MGDAEQGDDGTEPPPRPAVVGAPRLPRMLVHRPRLTARLDSGAPLAVVLGMGGAGKTVLLADWARRATLPVPGQWVQLRRQGTGRAAFWSDVAGSLLDSGIALPGTALARLPAELESARDPRTVLVRAFSGLPSGVHLVLDNYERATDPEIPLDLAELLAFGDRVSATLATRSLAALEPVLAAGRIDAEVVAPVELRFRDDEVAELLRLSGHAPTPDLVEAVQRAADGLALPVRAAVASYSVDGGAGGRAFGAAGAPGSLRIPAEVVDHVAATVILDDDRAGFRDLLRRVAVPESVTEELARALTGDDSVRRRLDLAEGRGLGLWTRRGGGQVFQFSTVVRQALRDEFGAEQPEALMAVHRTHALWAEQHELPLVALGAALESGDLELASQIGQRNWAALLGADLRDTVSLLGTLPLGRIRRHPVLAMMLGLGLTSLGESPLRVIDLFTLAIAASRVRAARTEAVERFVLLVGESSAYRLTGRFEQAGRSAARALRHFEELSPDDRDGVSPNAHEHLAQLGLSLLYAGSPDAALRTFRAAYSAAVLVRDPRARARPLSLIAVTLALMGDLVETAAVLAQLEAEPERDGWEGSGAAFHSLARGFLAIEQFDFAAAAAEVAAVSPAVRESEHRGILLTLQALIDLGTHRHRAGGIELELILATPRTPELPRSYTEVLTGLLALEFTGAGRSARAEAALESSPPDSAIACLVEAIIALLGDQPAEALRLLGGIRHRRGGSRHVAAAIGWVRSAVLLRLGNHDLALDLAVETVALVQSSGLAFSVLLVPDVDRVRLAQLAERRGAIEAAAFFAAVAGRRSFLPDSLARIRLTEREAAVLAHLVETGSTAEIAAALFVSVNTVKTQLKSLYRKLGAASRADALLAAAELGLLPG